VQNAQKGTGRIGAEGVIRRLDDTSARQRAILVFLPNYRRAFVPGIEGRCRRAFFVRLERRITPSAPIRPTRLQKYDFEAKGDWDIVAKDFGGVADRLGC
jgi:hypothetical protein